MPRQKFFILTIIAIALGTVAAGSFALAGNQSGKTASVPFSSPAKATGAQEKLSAGDAKNPVINRVSTDKKIIALTFDADMTRGMEQKLKSGKVKSWYNEEVVKTLEQTRTPATLFLTGLWIENYPEITKELSLNPLFEIANHSYSHPGFVSPCYNLPAISDSSADWEIAKTDDLLKEYAPNYKKYFRFPGFCHDEYDIGAVQKYGYQIVHGDVIAGDGFTRNAAGIIYRVVSRAKPGSIVILHMHGGQNAPSTGKALPEIIRQLKEKGYKFVKISELLSKN